MSSTCELKGKREWVINLDFLVSGLFAFGSTPVWRDLLRALLKQLLIVSNHRHAKRNLDLDLEEI